MRPWSLTLFQNYLKDIVKSISKKFDENCKKGARKYIKKVKGLRKKDNLISYEASRGRTSLFRAFFFERGIFENG